MRDRRVNSRAVRSPREYRGGRDDAYVYRALVGRLTAAVHTYALDGRRFGGRSRISLQEGRPAGGGGPDQEVER
ncbi:hypothetical protein GCM10010424_69990 [Streptomyces lienomycini]